MSLKEILQHESPVPKLVRVGAVGVDVHATYPANKTTEAKSVTPAPPAPGASRGEKNKSSPGDLAYSTHLKVSLAAGDRVIDWPQLRVKEDTPLTRQIAEAVYRELRVGPVNPGSGIDLVKPLTTCPYFSLPPFSHSLWKDALRRDNKSEETKEGESSEPVEGDDLLAEAWAFREKWEVTGPAAMCIPVKRATLVKSSTKKGVPIVEALDRQRVDSKELRCCLAVQLALPQKKRQYDVKWSDPDGSTDVRKAQSTSFALDFVLKILKQWCYAVRLKSQRALRAIVQNSCNLGFKFDLSKPCQEPWLLFMASDILLDVLEDRLESRMKFVTCEMAQRLLNDEEHRDPVPPPKWLKLQPSLSGGPPVVSYMRGEMYAWWVKLTHASRPRYDKPHGEKSGFIEQSANNHLMQAQCLLQLKKGFPDISHAFLADATSDWYGLAKERADPVVPESSVKGVIVCGLPTQVLDAVTCDKFGRFGHSDPVSVALLPHSPELGTTSSVAGQLVSVIDAPFGTDRYRHLVDRGKFPLLVPQDPTPGITPSVPPVGSLSVLCRRELESLLPELGLVFDEMIDAVQDRQRDCKSVHLDAAGTKVVTTHSCSSDRPIATPPIKATFEANRPTGGTFFVFQEYLVEFSRHLADLTQTLDEAWDSVSTAPSVVSSIMSSPPSSQGSCASNGSFWWPGGRDAYHEEEPAPAPVEESPETMEKRHEGLSELRRMAAELSAQVFRVPIGEFTSSTGKVITIDSLMPVAAMTLARSAVLSSLISGLRVLPQALPEPFKVRLISKGPALAYWLARLMQKHMHSSLTLLPEFELSKLSGERSIAEVVTEVLGTPVLEPGPRGLKAASCDYKGSTDNLAPSVSEQFASKWAKRFGYSPLMTELLLRTLTRHVLVKETQVDPAVCWKRWSSDGLPWPLPEDYPEEVRLWLGTFLEDGEFVTEEYKQNWGQLMGSCTSFPVLCAANLALTLVGLRRAEKDIPYVDQVWAQKPFKGDLRDGRLDRKGEPLPCRDPLRGNAHFGRPIGHSGCVVNGDDLLYLAFATAIAIWKKVTTTGGLAPSQGKNYVSHLFGNINSTMFTLGFLQFDPVPVPSTAHLASQATEGPSAPPVRVWLHVPYPNLAVLMPSGVLEYEEFLACGPSWQNAYLNVNAKFSSDARPRMQASRVGWCAETSLSKDDMCCWWIRAWAPYLAYIPKHYMNWFHPRQLGGFGLEATRPYDSTPLQLRIAKAHMDNVDPDQWLENAIGFGPDEPEVLTSTREDALVVERHLIDRGVVKRVLLHDKSLVAGQVVPDLSRMEMCLVLSGFSGHVLPTLRKEGVGFPISLEERVGELDGLHYSDRAYPGAKAACRRAERLAKSSRQDYQISFSCVPITRDGPLAGTMHWTSRSILKKAQCWIKTCQTMAKKSAEQSGRTTVPASVHAWVNRVVVTVMSEEWRQTSFEPVLQGSPLDGRVRFGAYPVTKTGLERWNLDSDLEGPPGFPIRVQTTEVSPHQLLLEWPADWLLQQAFGDDAFESEADAMLRTFM